MEHIKDLLSKTIAKRGLKSKVGASLVLAKANEWLKERLPEQADFLEVTSLKDGALIICAKNSIAAAECHLLSLALLEYLKASCPDVEISQIRMQREASAK